MNFIYDIALNLNDKLYEFYDWNEEDNIKLYLKIPIIKVEDDVIKDFINSTFIIDKSILSRIENLSELCDIDLVKSIKYLAVFSSENKALAIEFDNSGKSIKKSYLSIDEESDILEYSKMLKYKVIDYKIIKKEPIKSIFNTRNELSLRDKIHNLIENMYKNKEYEKINYIYYEIYNEKITSYDKSYIKLINLLDSNKINNLKDIFFSFEKK